MINISLVTIFCLGGCEGEQASIQTKPTSCNDHDDCGTGKQCEPAIGGCMDPTPPQGPLAIALTPPAGSELAKDQRLNVTLLGGNQFNATLYPVLKIKGTVAEIGAGPGQYIPCNILLESEGSIPGTTLTSSTVAQATFLDGVDATFVVDVIPGRPYVIQVDPEDPERPTEVLSRVFQPGNDHLDIQLPTKSGPNAYPRISGTIHDVGNLDSEGNALPLGGVQVEAQSTEFTLDGTKGYKLTSTIAITDPNTGAYSLLVPAYPATYKLRLNTTTEMSGKLIAKLQTDPKYYNIEVQGTPAEEIKTDALLVKTRPAVKGVFRLEGTTYDGAEIDLESGAIFANGVLDDGGTHSAQGKIGPPNPGVWETELLEGSYTVTVLPTPGTPLSGTQQTIIFSASQPQVTLQLSPRTEVKGYVEGWDKKPLVGVDVVAVRQNPIFQYAVPNYAVTNEKGTFNLWLDPGEYVFIVAPRPDTPYPRFVDKIRVVEGKSTAIKITVPAPQVIYGSVTEELGNGVEDVTVSAYRLVKQPSKNSGLTVLEDVRLLGTALTDDQGLYILLTSPGD
ncbi:MAG: hypothetical protein HUU55_10395 [Myxococcales bacterium]|nr:hypothetical protein [Myxococcales bacterium]